MAPAIEEGQTRPGCRSGEKNRVQEEEDAGEAG